MFDLDTLSALARRVLFTIAHARVTGHVGGVNVPTIKQWAKLDSTPAGLIWEATQELKRANLVWSAGARTLHKSHFCLSTLGRNTTGAI